MTDKTAWEGQEPNAAVIKGSGFNSRGGGFTRIHVDGVKFTANEVARRVNNFPALEAERDEIEQHRTRLWRENRELVSKAQVERAACDTMRAERDALREALEKARLLIGAGKGDHPNDAIRESNVNQAWHILRQALAISEKSE